MPYKKKYAVKRRPTRKAPRRAAKETIQGLLQGAALGYLKRRLGLNTEHKFVDVSGSTTASATLTANIACPTIAQGSTDNQRSGASLRVTSVETRMSFTAAVAFLPCNVRIIQTRHREASNATSTEILETNTDITSPINKNAAANGITILKDMVIQVNGSTAGDGAAYVQWTHSGANDHMLYLTADTTGVPTNLLQGAIQTWVMLDGGFSISPVITSTSRFLYVDN